MIRYFINLLNNKALNWDTEPEKKTLLYFIQHNAKSLHLQLSSYSTAVW